MVAAHTVDGDSFRVEKPRLWLESRLAFQSGFDPQSDSDRLALAPLPETQTAAKLDHVTLIFNFFDELRRIATVKK